MENKISGIYCIENKITNMVYIGLSKNINNRWKEHKYRLNRNIHPNNKLQNAWNKYGEESFEFFVLEKCDKNIIYEREKYWIQQYKSYDRNLGYNLSTGGENTSEGSTWSNEQKDAFSQKLNPKKVIQVDIYGNIIKTWRSASNADRILDLSASKIKQCCEHQAIHCGNYLWFYEDDEMLNDKEVIRKFVLSNSSYIDIPILQYDLYGNYIDRYSNFSEIQSKLNLNNVIEIRECCNHKNYCSNNYIWLFELDNFVLTDEYLLKCRLISELYEIEQYDFNGNLVGIYTKYTLPNKYLLKTVISNCGGFNKTAYGYVWKYKGDNKKTINKDTISLYTTKKKRTYNKVLQFDMNFNLIKEWNSLSEIKQHGYKYHQVRNCCLGKIENYENCLWKYKEEYVV